MLFGGDKAVVRWLSGGYQANLSGCQEVIRGLPAGSHQEGV